MAINVIVLICQGAVVIYDLVLALGGLLLIKIGMQCVSVYNGINMFVPEANLSTYLGNITVAAGVSVFVLLAVGTCAAVLRHTCLIVTDLAGLCLLIVAQIVFIIIVIPGAKEESVQALGKVVKSQLESYKDGDLGGFLVYHLQEKLKCCGWTEPNWWKNDRNMWSIPYFCYEEDNKHLKYDIGCEEAAKLFVDEITDAVVSAVVIAVMIEVIDLVIVLSLFYFNLTTQSSPTNAEAPVFIREYPPRPPL